MNYWEIVADAATSSFGRLFAIGIAYYYCLFWREYFLPKPNKRIWRHYFNSMLVAAFLGFLVFGTHGQIVTDAGDPLFGGGSYEEDPNIKSEDKYRSGLKVFFMTAVLGIVGIYNREDKPI